ncbi:MAG TPA: heparan-alpha-glucosaminide N-acetyltransferase domain-containing protein, partial [Mucilaginibacter sp.]
MIKRIQSVDVLRGAVMVLMAIDHVRVYSGMPSGGTEPGIFFTRWITHFCVPAFVFLAGTSAFLYGQKINDRSALSRFLLTRGLLLVVLELTLIRFCWTFNLNYAQFTLAGVIWMLGWCMILLSVVVKLPVRVIWIAGLVMMFLQQIFGLLPHILPQAWRYHFAWFWEFIYSSGFEGPPGISILY